MYTALLATHNVVRWLVLASGFWAMARAWGGWRSRAVWTGADAAAGQRFVQATSLQFVIGLVLYAVSPLIRQGVADMGAAMRDPALRTFLVEHPLMMLLSIALVHIGSARVRKATSDSGRFQAATVWWGLGVTSLLAMMPWARRLLPF